MIRTFRLPLPPSVNQLYPGKLRRHKSDKYYAWELAAAIAMRQQQCYPFEHDTTQHHWALDVWCVMPNWKGDMDNTIKAGVDFIAGWFRLDDRYLTKLHIERYTGPAQWTVTLTIEGA